MIRALEVNMTVQEVENINMNMSSDENVNMNTGEVITTGSTDNYEDLRNLPKINSNLVKGNKNGNELGLINSGDTLGLQEIDRMFNAVFGL